MALMALYVVLVPQLELCLKQPLRFRLAMDTLAVQLMIATLNPITDFHCQAINHTKHISLPPSKKVVFKDK